MPWIQIRINATAKTADKVSNMLLGRDAAVDGMKTGYTDAAGYCLVASAQRDFPNGKRRLISVVMGTASREARASESQKLLNWGYTAWDAVRLFEGGKPVATVPVWKGQSATAALGAQQSVLVTVPKGEGDKLKTAIARTDPLVAPLTQGQTVSEIGAQLGLAPNTVSTYRARILEKTGTKNDVELALYAERHARAPKTP